MSNIKDPLNTYSLSYLKVLSTVIYITKAMKMYRVLPMVDNALLFILCGRPWSCNQALLVHTLADQSFACLFVFLGGRGSEKGRAWWGEVGKYNLDLSNIFNSLKSQFPSENSFQKCIYCRNLRYCSREILSNLVLFKGSLNNNSSNYFSRFSKISFLY